MKKTYYFQHDFEAISDPKIQYLIAKFGGTGYALWWRIVEMLHQDENNKLPLREYVYLSIDNQLHLKDGTSKEFINICIDIELQLLQTDGEYFWSERVLKNVGKMQELKEKRSSAGKKSAEKRTENQQVATSVEQTLTSVQQNPTKENKRKENKYIYPCLSDVTLFFEQNGYSKKIAEHAWNYYEDAGWKDSKGNKVKNWKQKMRGVWFRDEYKINKPTIANFSMPIN